MLAASLLADQPLIEGANSYRDFYYEFEPSHSLPVNPPGYWLDPYLGIKTPQSYILQVFGGHRSLTFVVAAVNSTLYSLDSYVGTMIGTIDNSLTLPLPENRGQLQFRIDWPDEGPTDLGSDEMEYRVNLQQRLVLVRFREAANLHYSQIANCLVAGIDGEQGDLAELWLQNVAGLEAISP